jgi:hypothetical protein
MKRQMLKKSALLNLGPPAAMLLAFAATAHAQGANGYGVQASGPNGMLQAKDAADKDAIKQYIDRRETDSEYQKTIHDQPSAKGSTDPWGNVRATTPAPAAKSAAKSATKSASTKPAKPAAGAAPNGQ